MNVQPNRTRIGIGTCVLAIVLGLSLLAFASDLPANRAPVRAVGAPPGASALFSGQTALYLRFEGIEGESTDKEHAGWSNALSFSQGVTVSEAGGPGIGAGRPVLKDVVVTKPVDKASPKLALAACQGDHHKRVRIDVTRVTSAGHQTFYAYDFADVLITGYKVSGSAGPQGMPVEEISFSFREIKATYTPYDSKSNPQPSGTYSYKRM